MYTRRGVMAASAMLISLSGCSGSGDNSDEADDGNGGNDGGDIGSEDPNNGASNECDPAVIESDSTNTVRWEGYANGAYEIESVDLTVSNVVDFPVNISMYIYFYEEEGEIEPSAIWQEEVVLDGGETNQYDITRTGLDSTVWDVEMEVSCP